MDHNLRIRTFKNYLIMIAATILLSIAGTTLLWSIIVSIVTDDGHQFLGAGMVITGILGFAGIAILFTTPTNGNVRKGEAHYIEQNHIEIVNGDTINNYKTYQIEWIENSK